MRIKASDGDSLGEFQVTGTKLMVTDPCYTRSTWCQGTVENALPGKWLGSAEYSDEGSWGERVSRVTAEHESFDPSRGYWTPAKFEVGVDSGQAGIFDEARYPQGETGEYDDLNTFYGRACRATHDESVEDHPSGGVIAEGVVTSSGFGDGGYLCELHTNSDGKVDAVRVTFISDEEDEDEDDFSDDEDLDDEDLDEEE